MQEQGGCIIKDISGNYSLDRIKSNAPLTSSPHELYFDFGKIIPTNAIGTFHTHPVPLDDKLYPSGTDIDMAKKLKLPSIILGLEDNQVKSIRFDMNTPTDDWR